MVRVVMTALLLAAGCTGGDRVPSPTGALFAQHTLCSAQNPCTREVVITNQSGAEVRRFEIRQGEGACGSILDVHWVSESVVGAVCHGNPSLDYYYEVSVTTGKVLREYLGYGFVRSPDFARVA